jgi:hypothetical protein
VLAGQRVSNTQAISVGRSHPRSVSNPRLVARAVVWSGAGSALGDYSPQMGKFKG